ncbi:MAG: hypothetical protein ACRDE6_08240 [Candidatus Limnocylindria bacterium]
MASSNGDEPPHIDSSLDPIRAAIRMVADGSAERVTVYMPAPHEVLPAARSLARAAGVVIESSEESEAGTDVVVAAATPRSA